MSNFEKVLTTLNAGDSDIHEASEATKKRMETLDRRLDGEKEAAEVQRLTKTAENVLQVEVVLNAANLSTLKTNLGEDGFKEFLRNIAHRNQNNRATALRQMETSLGLTANSLNLSMSDKHSEQLIRTEILDHIAQQLLGGSNLTIAANYLYGSDQALDVQLDAMSDQVIAMLEGFKESNSLKDVDPKTASYNALYKASDQRYFDDASLESGNKLRGGVMGAFAETMANEGQSISYKDLANQFLAQGIDLNTKELVILTGNGMLPFDARTRSQFQFQYLTYLPELGGYAGLMANGCGDAGKEGNFVFIKDEQSETSKKRTKEGFTTEEQRKLNEEKKKLEKMTKADWIEKAENEGKDTTVMTEEDWRDFKEQAKNKLDDADWDNWQKKQDAALKEAETKTKEEEKKLEEERKVKEEQDNFNRLMEAEAEKAKIIEDKTWETIDAEGTLYKDGSPTRGVVRFNSPDGTNMAGKTVHILMQDPVNPGQPGKSAEFIVRPDGTVELPNNVYLQQTESGMADIVVSNESFTVGTESGLPEGSKEVELTPVIDNSVPKTDNNVNKELQPSNRWEPILRSKVQNLFKKGLTLPPYPINILENSPEASSIQKSGLGITLKELEDYVVDQARPQDPKEITDWGKIDNAIRDIRHRLFVVNKIRTLKYRLNGEKLTNKEGSVDTGPLFSPKEKAKELALDFLASSPTLEKKAEITLTKAVVIDGVIFPRVVFESTGIGGGLKIKDSMVEDENGNKYKAVVSFGSVLITRQ